MRLEWLEDILAVAETGSLSEAATRRHLTQSAFSRRVQAIDGYIGVELFDRGHQPLHLRPGTEAQRPQMQRLVQELRHSVDALRQGERMAHNRVVLASQHALTTALMPRVIRRVEDLRRDIQIGLRAANLDECVALLLARQADLLMVYDRPDRAVSAPWRDVDYIEQQLIGRDALVPIASAALAARLRSALPPRAHVAPPDQVPVPVPMSVLELPLIAYPAAVFLGQIMAQEIWPALPAGVRLLPRVETALTPAAVELAAEGLGVAWVPRSLFLRLRSGRDLTELSDLLPVSRLDVLALRLVGQGGAASAAVWQIMTKTPLL